MKGMPPSGCSDNAFEVFRWLERLVPISGYPPKVPSLSFESAIPLSRKCHRNETKVPSGLRRPYGRGERSVQTGREWQADCTSAAAEESRGGRRAYPRRAPREGTAGAVCRILMVGRCGKMACRGTNNYQLLIVIYQLFCTFAVKSRKNGIQGPFY